MFLKVITDLKPSEEFPTVMLQNVFNFSSWAILSPFKVKYDAHGERFFIESPLCRKIFGAIVHVSILAHIYLQLGECIQTRDGALYWTKMLMTVSWGSFLHTIIYTLWFKEKQMMDFLNKTRDLCDKLYYQTNYLQKRRKLIFLFKWLSPALAAGSGLCLGALPSPELTVELRRPANWTNIFSLQNIANVESASAYENDIFAESIWVFAVRYMIKFLANVTSLFGFLVGFQVALTLWMIIDDFVKGIKQTVTNTKRIEFVLDTLVDISNIFEACGSAFGHFFAITGVGLIPVLAIEFRLFFQENMKGRIEFVSDFIPFLGTLIVAASCNAMIKSIQTWLYQSMTMCCNMVPQCVGESLRFRTTLVVNQISSNEFGISGKFFVITYGYVGTVCGLIVTYALVVSQFR